MWVPDDTEHTTGLFLDEYVKKSRDTLKELIDEKRREHRTREEVEKALDDGVKAAFTFPYNMEGKHELFIEYLMERNNFDNVHDMIEASGFKNWLGKKLDIKKEDYLPPKVVNPKDFVATDKAFIVSMGEQIQPYEVTRYTLDGTKMYHPNRATTTLYYEDQRLMRQDTTGQFIRFANCWTPETAAAIKAYSGLDEDEFNELPIVAILTGELEPTRNGHHKESRSVVLYGWNPNEINALLEYLKYCDVPAPYEGGAKSWNTLVAQANKAKGGASIVRGDTKRLFDKDYAEHKYMVGRDGTWDIIDRPHFERDCRENLLREDITFGDMLRRIGSSYVWGDNRAFGTEVLHWKSNNELAELMADKGIDLPLDESVNLYSNPTPKPHVQDKEHDEAVSAIRAAIAGVNFGDDEAEFDFGA